MQQNKTKKRNIVKRYQTENASVFIISFELSYKYESIQKHHICFPPTVDCDIKQLFQNEIGAMQEPPKMSPSSEVIQKYHQEKGRRTKRIIYSIK